MHCRERQTTAPSCEHALSILLSCCFPAPAHYCHARLFSTGHAVVNSWKATAALYPLPDLFCSLQIANIASADVKNIIVAKRPSGADADNLPTHWINVYQPLQDANSSSFNSR
jgi:hypothetical protein